MNTLLNTLRRMQSPRGQARAQPMPRMRWYS